MKRKYVYVVFCIYIYIYGISQNLVPNSSFETKFDCSFSLIESSSPWCGLNSVGYLNACMTPTMGVPVQYWAASYPSFQYPRNGNAYATFGFIFPTMPSTPSRYPHVKLTDTLKAGKIYCITYYVSLWNDCKYSTDKFGALLTATPFNCTVTSQNLYTGYTPQVVSPSGYLYNDTLNWQEVSGSFTAVGNEAYLTIGNFFPNAAHTYSLSYPNGVRLLAEYYLDDVSVEEVEVAKTRNDTLIMQGDSAIIGNNLNEAAIFSWQPSAGLNCTNCPNPKASPTITTTYTVTKTQCKSVTSDEMTVSVSLTGLSEEALAIKNLYVYPNPTNGILNIELKNIDTEKVSLTLTDVLGKEVLMKNYDTTIDVSFLENGIYFLSFYKNHQLLVTKKVVKQ